jgi:hypothetical protein
MIFILFDYKCFVIFKNSEANFVTALINTKYGAPLYYSIVAFRPFCFLMFAHAQCKCLEFLAMVNKTKCSKYYEYLKPNYILPIHRDVDTFEKASQNK